MLRLNMFYMSRMTWRNVLDISPDWWLLDLNRSAFPVRHLQTRACCQEWSSTNHTPSLLQLQGSPQSCPWQHRPWDRETNPPHKKTSWDSEAWKMVYIYIWKVDVNPGDILLHLSCHLLGKRFKDQHFSRRKFCRPDSPTSSWSGAWCRSTGIHCWCLCLCGIMWDF